MCKRYAQYIFLCPAALFWLWWKIFSFFMGEGRAFAGVSQFLSLFPGTSGSLLRAAFYSLALEGSSQDVVVGFLTTFAHPGARLGAHVSIGTGCNIGFADIGEHGILGSHVCIASGRRQHGMADTGVPMRLQEGHKERVTLGRDCWVGNTAIIMANVGEGAVVAAGSVVTQTVEAYSIVAGNPAREISSRRAPAGEKHLEESAQ